MKQQNEMRNEFITNALYRLDESTRMIKKSLAELNEEEVWAKPNKSSNSVGNLILHLRGNITQYAISSLGNTPDIRERDKEFLAIADHTLEELGQMLEETVKKAKKIIASCPEEELLRQRKVQGYNLSGLGIVIHVVEHYSYHTGQIAFWTKLLKDKDLGFYDGINLNAKNRNT